MSRITSGLMSSNTDNWATPLALFKQLDDEFHFNLDPCADAENHKCERYYDRQINGLEQTWGGGRQSVHESALRERDWEVGQESTGIGRKERCIGGGSFTGTDGHEMVGGCHESNGNPLYQRTCEIRGCNTIRPVPIGDRCVGNTQDADSENDGGISMRTPEKPIGKRVEIHWKFRPTPSFKSSTYPRSIYWKFQGGVPI